MKKLRWLAVSAIIVLSILFLTSCHSGNSTPGKKDPKTSSSVTTKETSGEIHMTTPFPTKKNSPTPTHKPTPEPSPTPIKIVAIPDYDYFNDFSSTDILYIKIPMDVHILETGEESAGLSADFSDKLIELPTGTVLWTVAKSNPYHSEEILALRTFEGQIVGVDITRQSDGSILYDDNPLDVIFVLDETNLIESPDAENVDETELQLWEMTDSSNYYHRLIVRVDWNKDGTQDELIFKNDDSLLVFTDGKTGVQTETEIDTECWNGCERALLCQNSEGDYALLIQGYFVNGSEPSVTHVVSYSSDSIIAIQRFTAYINYRDGHFYKINDSNILGNCYYIETPVNLNDDFSFSVNSDSEDYVGGWLSFSYTIADVNICVWNGSQYVNEILAPGMAVIPVKTIIDCYGDGFLYVKLADRREARMPISFSNADSCTDILISGIRQVDAFYCYWGG